MSASKELTKGKRTTPSPSKLVVQAHCNVPNSFNYGFSTKTAGLASELVVVQFLANYTQCQRDQLLDRYGAFLLEGQSAGTNIAFWIVDYTGQPL